MSMICFPGKVFYMNGMTTSLGDATSVASKIQGVSLDPIEVVHNDTTSADKAALMGAKLIAGAVGLTLVVCTEKKSDTQKAIGLIGGAASVALLLSSLADYIEIQERKNAKAQELAGKVAHFLGCNPLSGVTLIFHSQGADIGQRALYLLRPLSGRINVITIGGMVDIPPGLAGRVTNYTDVRDLVSNGAKKAFSRVKATTYVSSPTCQSGICHDASDYVNVDSFKRSVTELTQPICYTAISG